MVEIVKQSMTDIWASAGDVVMPDSSKIQEGWLVEVPPRQYWNWMQNRTDNNIAYLLQRGIPAWDSSTEYILNKSIVMHNGVVYRALLTGVNKEPGVATTYWKKAFADSSAASDSIASLTPAADRYPYFTGASTAALGTITSFARSILDDVDANAVRTTIGAQQADATLTALTGLTTATNKLPYFTGVDVANVTDLTAFGRTLIDDADAAAARTTLGLGTAATATVTTSTTDTTNGRVLLNGAHGLGTDSQQTAIDPNTVRYGSILAPVSQANAPSTECVMFTGGRSAGARASQLAVDHGAPAKAWIRGYNAGRVGAEWGAWSEVFTTSNQLSLGTTASSGRTALGLGTVATQAANNVAITGGTITGITDLAITDGGTGASDAATARTNLSVYSKAEVDSGLASKQASDATLTALAGLTTSANKLPYFTGTDVAAVTDLSAFGRSLIDDVDASSARTTLGLGTAAVANVTTSTTDSTTGRLLKVGDFGLGITFSSWDTYDLNAIPATGFYFVNGSTSTNLPSAGSFGTLIHIEKGSEGTQLFTQQGVPNSAKTWQRTKAAFTWGAWQEVMTSTNVTTSPTDSTAGRLLKVGDFGLGSYCVQYFGDLNALSTTGFFRGSSMTNAPSADWYYVRVSIAGPDYCTQEATELTSTSPRVYIRSKVGGVWTSWREVSIGVNPKSACTAWVNFNGTGTVAIRDSYNVSSITDNGTGEYTVNFTTAMANANYALFGTAGNNDAAGDETILFPVTSVYSTTQVKVRSSTGGGNAFDSPLISVTIFGGK